MKVFRLVFVFLWAVLFFFNKITVAQIIVADNERQLIGKNCTIYEDKTNSLPIDSIIGKNFVPLGANIFSGPASASAFWFRFEVRKTSHKDIWLEVGSNYIWYADLYTVDTLKRSILLSESGAMRPPAKRYQGLYAFWMPLSNNNTSEGQTYFLRVNADFPYQLPLSIGTADSLRENKSINDVLTAGFIGAMLIMLLYNLFLYFSTKDHTYFWYLGYIFFMSLGMAYANGYPFVAHIEFWGIDFKWWNEKFLIWHPLAYLFVGMFGLSYLKLKENLPKARWVLLVSTLVVAVVLPLLTLLGVKLIYLIETFQVGVLSIYITSLVAGYILVFRGNKQARFYVLGWTFMLIHVFIFFGTVYGLFPYNSYTHNSIYFGAVLETWMFSLALGDRINIIRREKEENERKYFSLLEQQNLVLEEKIKERTQQLQNAFEELEQTNDQLSRQTQQLEQSNRTKDKLFSIIGHDLRNPISTLKSFLDLLLEYDYDKDKLKGVALRMRKRMEEIYFMMNNLLIWANNQQYSISTLPEVFPVYESFQRAESILRESASNKSISIEIAVPADMEVKCDPQQFDIIIMNLLTNAVKFSPHNSNINVSADKKTTQAQFSIADQGAGMSKKIAQTLFENKINTSTKGTDGESGSGIGLSLCYDFVTNNGGEIWVESEVDKGSTFFFTLPLGIS